MSFFDRNVDLLLAVLLQLVAFAVLLRCGWIIGRRYSARWSGLCAVAALGLTVSMAIGYHGSLTLAKWLPFSNTIILGNCLPSGAAILAGIVAGQTVIPAWRRYVIATMLGVIAWYTVACDLIPHGPEPGPPLYVDGVCIQTTPDSCSACSAVSLLLEYGIPASESEMMELCLTRHGGTPELGLYRGLKLKTAGTDWDVEILQGKTIETLLQAHAYPALLLVQLTDLGEPPPPRWQLGGTNHAVIAYGMIDSERLEVGDPSSNRKIWSRQQVLRYWQGSGLRLVHRKSVRELPTVVIPNR